MVANKFGICHERRRLAYSQLVSHASSSIGTQCGHSRQFPCTSTDTTIATFARVTCRYSLLVVQTYLELHILSMLVDLDCLLYLLLLLL